MMYMYVLFQTYRVIKNGEYHVLNIKCMYKIEDCWHEHC